jgi:hypothetical protein
MSVGDQVMRGRSRGELPEFTCHCGPQLIDGRVQYLTFNEDDASGRTPVQTSSVGDYPGPRDMGLEVIDTNDTTTTYQRSPDTIKMSG